MEIEKAELWARRARLSKDVTTILAEFARRFLYGAIVPTGSEVRQAAYYTRNTYHAIMHSDSGVSVYVFTLTPCHRATNLVAFKVGAYDRVEVCKYRRGECPWFDYTTAGGTMDRAGWDRADWWVSRAGFDASPELSVFARESLYGEAVPDIATLLKAFRVTRSLYSERLVGNGADVFVFAFNSCRNAVRLVAFKHTHHDDTVERLSYRRGECPWLSYQFVLGRVVKRVKDDLDKEAENNG